MTFFIFHSVFAIKDNRYFVIMAPPVAYFMILGLSEISNRIKFKFRNSNITFPLLAIILTMIMLLSTASTLPLFFKQTKIKNVTDEKMKLASQWLINYDPDYKN